MFRVLVGAECVRREEAAEFRGRGCCAVELAKILAFSPSGMESPRRFLSEDMTWSDLRFNRAVLAVL